MHAFHHKPKCVTYNKLQAACMPFKTACLWHSIQILLILISDSQVYVLSITYTMPNLLRKILLQGIRGRGRGTERRQLTFWLRCRQILFAVLKCLLRISHWTFDARQNRYSVPTSAVRHRSSLDYTSDAATVHGKTGVINYAAAKRWRQHLLGRPAMYLMVKFSVHFKLM